MSVNIYYFLGCPTGDAAFDKTTNQDIFGGWEEKTADTLDKCMETCLNNSYAECRGFGFASDKCLIYVHANTTNNGTLGKEYDFYVRKQCGKLTLSDKFICFTVYQLSFELFLYCWISS